MNASAPPESFFVFLVSPLMLLPPSVKNSPESCSRLSASDSADAANGGRRCGILGMVSIDDCRLIVLLPVAADRSAVLLLVPVIAAVAPESNTGLLLLPKPVLLLLLVPWSLMLMLILSVLILLPCLFICEADGGAGSSVWSFRTG